MARTLITVLTVALFGVICVCATTAQGVETKDDAVVLYGSAANCTQPATIDYETVKEKTAEWKKIRSEGVRPGSARYQLLISDMNRRIRRACREVAEAQGRDCVVRHGDISDDNGLEVADVSDDVVESIEDDNDALASH